MKEDTPACYCLEGNAGPAALRAWGGKMKKRRIPSPGFRLGKRM